MNKVVSLKLELVAKDCIAEMRKEGVMQLL